MCLTNTAGMLPVVELFYGKARATKPRAVACESAELSDTKLRGGHVYAQPGID